MTIKISFSEIERISKQVLIACDVPEEHAKIVAASIVYAHKRGKGTHGITRLPIYVNKIKSGFLNPKTPLVQIVDTPGLAIYDANHGFGQVAAWKAIDFAGEKALKNGISAIGIRNSNNFGTAAFFCNKAANQGFISIIFSNSAPAIAPWGGSKPLFGTNPIAYGFPAPDGKAPIILDMAVSNVARGKIRLAAKNNEKIPLGWALDENGAPTDNPHEAIKGTMLPIGEHKGAGLAMIVDLLAGLLTGSGFASGVKPLNTNNDYSKNGHFIILLNYSIIMHSKDYEDKLRDMVNRLNDEGNCKNIYYPGEKSYLNLIENSEWCQLSERVIQELNRVLNNLNLCKVVES